MISMSISKKFHLAIFLFITGILLSCTSLKSERSVVPKADVQDLSEYSTAYFASGCFWCVEAVYESIEGVAEAVSGYAGGHTPEPTYQTIGTGRTGHAETVAVFYDPSVVTYEQLLKAFFLSGDPTTPNRQGPDSGPQYRSMIFYQNAAEEKAARDMVKKLTEEAVFARPIITEIVAFEKFFEAEDYHQDYERLNPNNPYVQGVSIPRLNRFKKNCPELLKK